MTTQGNCLESGRQRVLRENPGALNPGLGGGGVGESFSEEVAHELSPEGWTGGNQMTTGERYPN